MKKGNTIQQFLYKCLENLRKEFSELRAVSVEGLMYIKEDLIIPQVSGTCNSLPTPTHTHTFLSPSPRASLKYGAKELPPLIRLSPSKLRVVTCDRFGSKLSAIVS